MPKIKTKYKYLEFDRDGEIWIVFNHVTDEQLGRVEYFTKWKQWESVLNMEIGFTVQCHVDMADFLSQLNIIGNPKAKKKKQNKCKICSFPIAESETICGECACEDDCRPD